MGVVSITRAITLSERNVSITSVVLSPCLCNEEETKAVLPTRMLRMISSVYT